eukprot:1289525-Pleurochrysis_carterae.AAC.1
MRVPLRAPPAAPVLHSVRGVRRTPPRASGATLSPPAVDSPAPVRVWLRSRRCHTRPVFPPEPRVVRGSWLAPSPGGSPGGAARAS